MPSYSAVKSPHSTYVQVARKAQRITGTELTNAMNASETLHGLALTFADGMAVRSPDATAMDLIGAALIELSCRGRSGYLYRHPQLRRGAPEQRRLRPF